MKTRIFCLTGVLIMLLGYGSSYAQDNLLTNGGWEDGVDTPPWGYIGPFTHQVVTNCEGADVPEYPIEGNYCLQVDVPATGYSNFWDGYIQHRYLVFEQGKKYTFSCFAKCKSGTGMLGMKVEQYGAPNRAWSDVQFPITNTWQEYHQTTDILPLREDPADVAFFVCFQEQTIWIDNVRFYEGDWVPASLAKESARAPVPTDGATDVIREEDTLSWRPGDLGGPVPKHDVYVGTVFEDVNNASRNNPMDVLISQGQDANSYDLPGRLDFGTTYYWRIDEVDTTSNTFYRSDVWNFTSEPEGLEITSVTPTASSSSDLNDPNGIKTVDGSGLVNGLHDINSANMWLSGPEPQPTWIQYEFDKAYKLHQMLVWNYNLSDLAMLGIKEVSVEYSEDGATWTQLTGVTEFAQASGLSDNAVNTIVNFDGAIAKYVKITAISSWGGEFINQYGLSEVRFLYIPVWAREIIPGDGATNVATDVTLSWRNGREADVHKVYVSDNPNAVLDGTVYNVNQTSCNPTGLELNKTYYWIIEEVNDAEIPTAWKSEVLSFTVEDYVVVDNFESFDDQDQIWWSWHDGLGYAAQGSIEFYAGNGTGSVVGDPNTGSFTEETIVHSGDQAMPYRYDNAKVGALPYSEATLALDTDWTVGAPTTLVIWFYGDPDNAAETMYVKVNGVMVPYDGDIANLQLQYWTVWPIDLAQFGDLSNVSELTIGFEPSGAVGGSGKMIFDDITLTAVAPVPPSELVWIEAESAATITAPMQKYDDAGASGGAYIGSEPDAGDSNNNPLYPDGTAAITFNVAGGVYQVQFRVSITNSDDSFWVSFPSATDLTPGTNSSNPGWVRMNSIPAGAAWHWVSVFSNDHGNQVVNVTLPAGTNTIRIGNRESGADVDAIVFVKID